MSQILHCQMNINILGKQTVYCKSVKIALWLHILRFLSVATAFMSFKAHHIFYAFDIEKPSLLSAFNAALLNQIWEMATVGIMLGLIYRYGWFSTTFINFPTYRIIKDQFKVADDRRYIVNQFI